MLCSTDPIADMLTRIRNALMRHRTEAVVPYSQIKAQIMQVFLNYKYIAKFKIQGDGKDKCLIVTLTNDKLPISPITNLKRVSRPGRRVHVGWQAIPKIKSGRGMTILSTDQGIMSDRHAKHQNLGGEILCAIY